MPFVFVAGAMGGGYYTHTGGGTNFVCLTNNPIYDKYQSGFQGSMIYGTEYETSFAGFARGDRNNHDAPCAVCYVRSRGSCHSRLPLVDSHLSRDMNIELWSLCVLSERVSFVGGVYYKVIVPFL